MNCYSISIAFGSSQCLQSPRTLALIFTGPNKYTVNPVEPFAPRISTGLSPSRSHTISECPCYDRYRHKTANGCRVQSIRFLMGRNADFGDLTNGI